MISCLRLVALLFCCGCMLLLIFTFTWHPLKERIPDEQVPKGLLSCDCEKSFQFNPKETLLLMGVGWIVLEKSRLDCSGDGDSWNFFWAKVEVEYLDLYIADDIANISSSLPELYASSPHSELWPVMFFISHFGNPKDFSFQTVVFLAEWFFNFLFAHNSANGHVFSFCSTLFIVLYQTSIRGESITVR